MIQFENTVEIERLIEDVFSYVANFENIPQWNYYVINVRQMSEGAPSEGALYHQIRKDDEQDYEIIDYQPNQRVTIRTTPGSTPSFERVFKFEEINGGTQIKDLWELDLGHNPLIERLGAGKAKSAVAENLGKLKQLLEHGETRLQDGRISRL